jgi:hypothetical protein
LVLFILFFDFLFKFKLFDNFLVNGARRFGSGIKVHVWWWLVLELVSNQLLADILLELGLKPLSLGREDPLSLLSLDISLGRS